MTKAAFNKIKAGLGEAEAYLDGSGNKRGYGIHVPARVNVKKIRTRLGLSQESFAQTYGFALITLSLAVSSLVASALADAIGPRPAVMIVRAIATC